MLQVITDPLFWVVYAHHASTLIAGLVITGVIVSDPFVQPDPKQQRPHGPPWNWHQ